MTTPSASLRAYIDDVVCLTHHILVMLYHNHRIARITQCLQGLYQALVISLMKSDTRLIEDIQNIDKFRANLRSKAYALALATRECTGSSAKREIAQAHIGQEAQSLLYLFENLSSNGQFLLGHLLLYPLEPLTQTGDRHRRQLCYIFACYLKMQRILLQATTTAKRTFVICHKLLSPLLALAGVFILGFRVYIFGYALPGAHLATSARILRDLDHHRFVIAIEDGIQSLLRDCSKWVIEGEIVAFTQRLERCKEDIFTPLAERCYASVTKRKMLVGDNLFNIEHCLLAKAVATRTSSLWRIKREGKRLGILEGDTCCRAHQVAGIVANLACVVVVDSHLTLTLAHSLTK